MTDVQRLRRARRCIQIGLVSVTLTNIYNLTVNDQSLGRFFGLLAVVIWVASLVVYVKIRGIERRALEQLDPPIPVNVKLNFDDGSSKPLDCIYIGQDDEGIHHWEALFVEPIPIDQRAWLSCDELPAHCGIVLNTEPGE